jgi:hemoglobin/transferrin/lactoferrin receptor protein
MLHGLALLLAIVLVLAPVASAQQPSQAEARDPDALVVTPARGAREAYEVPYATAVVDAARIEAEALRTLPQALRNTPGVLVQETSHGQGSPYIRGFTGFLNVLLVDGVRLNNSVFRAGPNQYWNTVDPFSLARIEVLRGPSSVLYGSDAVGGTVNALTLRPYTGLDGGPVGGRVLVRTAGAENYLQGRAEVSGAWERLGVLVGVSFKDFGDVHGGHDVGLQRETGYDERDADFRVEYLLADDVRLTALHQRVNQDDVPRTHSTVFGLDWEGLDVGSDLRRDLDQERELTYLQLHATNQGGLFDESLTSISFQRQLEDRDRIRSDGRREFQGFDVGTLGLSQHFATDSPAGRFTCGVDFYRDDVDSFLDKGANQSAADDIQGPVADDAEYATLGVFVQDELELTERLDLVLGARFEHASVDAQRVRDPTTDLPISIDDDWDALVGSARFGYDLEPARWRLFGGVSQGFRAPNLSDLTRFDTARSNEFEIPSPGLDPEHYTSFEVGVKHAGERLSAELALFHTDIRDQIQRVPTGATNADGDAEITKANVGDGFVRGVELAGSVELDADWSLFGNATWLDGEVSTFPTSAPIAADEPPDRLMPAALRLGVRWDEPARPQWVELSALRVADADELLTRDAGDTTRIPPGGTPGFTVLDLFAGWDVSDAWSLHVGLENLLDEDYRVHGSGQNRPGRNLIFGVTFRF